MLLSSVLMKSLCNISFSLLLVVKLHFCYLMLLRTLDMVVYYPNLFLTNTAKELTSRHSEGLVFVLHSLGCSWQAEAYVSYNLPLLVLMALFLENCDFWGALSWSSMLVEEHEDVLFSLLLDKFKLRTAARFTTLRATRSQHFPLHNHTHTQILVDFLIFTPGIFSKSE